MNILQCVGNIDPALGGSVEAARQLAIALDRLGHGVELVTFAPAADGLDRRLAGNGPLLGALPYPVSL